jgi:threonine synthase
LLGAFIGFGELARAGVIDRVPRLCAVQAAACCPLARAARGEGSAPAGPTLADGIAIASPIRLAQMVEAVRATAGAAIAVDEAAIGVGLRAAAGAGLFIEPTSAVAFAALGEVDEPRDGPVVVVVTGHGLKAAERVAALVT